jgi:hypothetical protein
LLARALVLLLVLFTGAVSAQWDGSLPFSERELTEALSARAPELATSDLRVERAGDLLVVSLGLKARVVDLAGSTGVDAARVVALVAFDLSLLEVRSLLPPERHAPNAPIPPPAPAPAAPDRGRVGVEGGVQHGLSRDDSWGFTLGLEGAVIARRFLSTLHASYWSMPSERSPYTGTLIQFDALSLRAALGMRISRYAFAVGPVYAHYWVRGGRGYAGDLFGASLQGALWLPAAQHARLGVRLHVDVYPRPALFYAGGPEPVLATPAWALGLALCAAWGWT